jgi:hypothetical protein
MKKEYIIGGLALLGLIGVVSYLNKPKRNSEGFFGANGRASKATQRWCAHRNTDGSVNYETNNFGGGCKKGWVAVSAFGDRTGV